MKTKKMTNKLILNKSTVADLKQNDMLNAVGGAASVAGSSCFKECQPELGHTQYGDTCYEFCASIFRNCWSGYVYCP